MKGEAWEQSAERHGDWGRDLALHVGRRYDSMSLAALGRSAGVSHWYTVAQALRRFECRARNDPRFSPVFSEGFRLYKNTDLTPIGRRFPRSRGWRNTLGRSNQKGGFRHVRRPAWPDPRGSVRLGTRWHGRD